MTKKQTITVKNYGDMLAQINQMNLIDYYERGEYQGEYLAIASDNDRIFFYQGSFGSCSGCDWLEDENITYGKRYEISLKNAIKYAGDIRPKYIIPKDDKDLVVSVLKLLKRFWENKYEHN